MLLFSTILSQERLENENFKRFLRQNQNRIGLFVIDECHIITSWSDFRPSLLHIGDIRDDVPNARWVCKSPTFMQNLLFLSRWL